MKPCFAISTVSCWLILADAFARMRRRSMLSWEQQRAVDREAPTHWAAPSGSKHRIDYRREGGPTVALRLQEAFGTAQTPRIAGGAVPLTFELLTPAQRPAQVTQDLAGFWQSSYQQVRSLVI